jgi:hypothetical protein
MLFPKGFITKMINEYRFLQSLFKELNKDVSEKLFHCVWIHRKELRKCTKEFIANSGLSKIYDKLNKNNKIKKRSKSRETKTSSEKTPIEYHHKILDYINREKELRDLFIHSLCSRLLENETTTSSVNCETEDMKNMLTEEERENILNSWRF